MKSTIYKGVPINKTSWGWRVNINNSERIFDLIKEAKKYIDHELDAISKLVKKEKKSFNACIQSKNAVVLLKEGVKYDGGKNRLDLLPILPLLEIGRVLTYGANKYSERNWERGMAWSRCYAALLRHLTAWWNGEDVDPETGISHLAHAACCLFFLIEYEARKTGKDDRPWKNQKQMLNECVSLLTKVATRSDGSLKRRGASRSTQKSLSTKEATIKS